ncbi:hypothetical protein SAY86_017994 [Trapa natans]|uniref:Uncharacterized protein n=1 Tax=Trapa natans TaxID=22666 RepID=A0AAN7M761_TRANT|nr:hypothetical protein SAY86_017994 [Trapa natans]
MNGHLMMYFIKACTPASGEDPSELSHVLTTTILGEMFSLKGPMSYSIIDVMVVLLMAPLAIPVKMTMHRNPERQTVVIERLVEEESLDRNEPLLASFCENDEVTVGMLLAVGEGEVKKRRRLKKGEDFNFFEALIKAVFWLIFLVYFIRGVQDTAILLSLFSFGNFAGRLGGGLVSEHYVSISIYMVGSTATRDQVAV